VGKKIRVSRKEKKRCKKDKKPLRKCAEGRKEKKRVTLRIGDRGGF